MTFEGDELAKQVRDSASCSNESKAKLIREIIDFEAARGSCTQTFLKKSGSKFARRGKTPVPEGAAAKQAVKLRAAWGFFPGQSGVKMVFSALYQFIPIFLAPTSFG